MGRLKGTPVTWEVVREIAMGLQGAVEGTSYGTPAFHVRKKLFVRLHQSRESIVINMPMDEREAIMQADPETFFITDHYQKYPYMLVRLSTVKRKDLKRLVAESWERCVPPGMMSE